MPNTIKTDQSKQREMNTNDSIKGIGRLWFAIIFTLLFVLVSVIPDWDLLLNKASKLHWLGVNLARYNVFENSIVTFMLQILLWNFMLALLTAPIFYLRIINVRIGSQWIVALIIPFVWSILLVRCLVYQSGYTHSGILDEVGQKILKLVTYLMVVTLLLSVTYLLADLF